MESSSYNYGKTGSPMPMEGSFGHGNNSGPGSMWANWNYRPRSTRLARPDTRVYGESGARCEPVPVTYHRPSYHHLTREDRYSHRLKYRSCPFPFEASMSLMEIFLMRMAEKHIVFSMERKIRRSCAKFPCSFAKQKYFPLDGSWKNDTVAQNRFLWFSRPSSFLHNDDSGCLLSFMDLK